MLECNHKSVRAERAGGRILLGILLGHERSFLLYLTQDEARCLGEQLCALTEPDTNRLQDLFALLEGDDK